MPIIERLYQFTAKSTLATDDIIFCGNASDAFNEVKTTVAGLIGAYPGLLSIGSLTTSANQIIYLTGAGTYAASSTLPSAVQSNITQLGTQSQALDMGTQLINNVVNPTSAQDAATKAYVDSVGAGLVDSVTGTANQIDVGGTAADPVLSLSATLVIPGTIDATMTDGQLLIGSTGAALSKSTLTAGTGISVANAGGSITISATGGGYAIATISGTTQAAAVNTTYIALNAGQTTVTLPGTCSVGDSVGLVGATANTGGWILTAASGDTIIYNGTTTSAGGTLTSASSAGQTIEVVCDVADTSWVVVDTVNTSITTA